MSRDIDTVRDWMGTHHPGVRIRQLQPSHPADDDGLWFFTHGAVEVQLESPSGDCPFLIESSAHDRRQQAQAVAEAQAMLSAALSL